MRQRAPQSTRAGAPRAGCSRHGEREYDAERAPVGRAGHRDGPAHQRHQLLAEGEPEPGAGVLPGDRGIGLAERVEEPALVLEAHPDARVLHQEAHVDPAGGHGAGGHRRADPALGSVNFTALSSRLVSTRPIRAGSPLSSQGTESSTVTWKSSALRCAGGDGTRDDLFERRRVRRPRPLGSASPPRVGEVEDVGDQREQTLSRPRPCVATNFVLLGDPEAVSIRTSAVPSKRGERGPDLMAHVGQEQRLVLVRPLGGGLWAPSRSPSSCLRAVTSSAMQ